MGSTSNFGWNTPTVGGDEDAWGDEVNATLQDIDTDLKSAALVAVAALDIDLSDGDWFQKTIAGDSTFTFSNAPASRGYGFVLELTHTSGTVTWPTSVKWPGDSAPSLTAGKTHLFGFMTSNGGTRWRGASLRNYTT